jgi:hypothetical protein
MLQGTGLISCGMLDADRFFLSLLFLFFRPPVSRLLTYRDRYSCYSVMGPIKLDPALCTRSSFPIMRIPQYNSDRSTAIQVREINLKWERELGNL